MTREEQILREMAEVLGDPDDARTLHAQLSLIEEPAPAPATDALARLRRQLAVPGWLMPALVVVVLASATAGPLGKHGLAAAEHLLWIGMVVVSLGLSALAARSPKTVLVGALAAALLPALTPAMPGPMDLVHCARFELVTAALPLAFAAYASWRSQAVTSWHLAAFAACGASAGNAALAVLCSGHPSHAGLIVAHASGVWLAALLGAAVGAPRWLKARAQGAT
ncbi:MAG: hypothetical protein KC621_27970 [Myxococcales bacterium]|nr:hypothetical protein [Myxococcales bacterium]